MNMYPRPFNKTNYGSERPLNARNYTPTPIMRERQPAAPSSAASTSSSVSPVSTSKDNDDTGRGWTPLAVNELIHTYDSKKDQFVGSSKKRNKVWKDITDQLKDMGFITLPRSK